MSGSLECLEGRIRLEGISRLHGELLPYGDKMSMVNTYGYSTAQLLVQILKWGDKLTRENIMKQATLLKNAELDLALPGVKISTGPQDVRVSKQLQMMKFNGERRESAPYPRGARPDWLGTSHCSYLCG